MDALAFDVTTPVSEAGLRAHVEHAMGLGLPEVGDFEFPRPDLLNIVASGPSARGAASLLTAYTLALNGALKVFTDAGSHPSFWACCDPQEMVVEFLDNPPKETVYFVASRCHPAVFERLKDRQVVLWHVADEATWGLLAARRPVQSWVSVTLTVFELMARLGWRDFAVWGWDACYKNGIGYAQPQRGPSGDLMDVEVGSRHFQTNPTWLLEAQTAAHALAGFPFPVLVHGDGLVAAVLHACMPRKLMTEHRS